MYVLIICCYQPQHHSSVVVLRLAGGDAVREGEALKFLFNQTHSPWGASVCPSSGHKWNIICHQSSSQEVTRGHRRSVKWMMAAPPGPLCCLLVAVWWLAWSHCLPSQVLTGADSESRTVVSNRVLPDLPCTHPTYPVPDLPWRHHAGRPLPHPQAGRAGPGGRSRLRGNPGRGRHPGRDTCQGCE